MLQAFRGGHGARSQVGSELAALVAMSAHVDELPVEQPGVRDALGQRRGRAPPVVPAGLRAGPAAHPLAAVRAAVTSAADKSDGLEESRLGMPA